MADHHQHQQCQHTASTSSVYQSLGELDFAKGLWSAALDGDVERTSRLLLQKGADGRLVDAAGYTPLHYAARAGHLAVCRLLVEQAGAEVDAATRAGRATALHRAVSAGHADVVEYLLEKRADASLQDADGKNSLHRAVEANNLDMCRQLLLLKSSTLLVDARDAKGHTPLDLTRNPDILQLFLSNMIH